MNSYSKHTLQFPSPFPHNFPAHWNTRLSRTVHTRSTHAGVGGTLLQEVDGERKRQTLLLLPRTELSNIFDLMPS